jgi:hypothetical protein
LGITHSAITHNTKNIKLDKNPAPKDNSTAYVRPKADKANTGAFSSRLKGWRFSDSDKPKVKKIIDEHEKPPKK